MCRVELCWSRRRFRRAGERTVAGIAEFRPKFTMLFYASKYLMYDLDLLIMIIFGLQMTKISLICIGLLDFNCISWICQAKRPNIFWIVFDQNGHCGTPKQPLFCTQSVVVYTIRSFILCTLRPLLYSIVLKPNSHTMSKKFRTLSFHKFTSLIG